MDGVLNHCFATREHVSVYEVLRPVSDYRNNHQIKTWNRGRSKGCSMELGWRGFDG